MFLDNLTTEDVKILDEIWALDTEEELAAYMARQSPALRQRTSTLVELLVLADIDDQVNAMTTYPDAERMLENIIN